ncbi:recombinase RecT (plasmid) [Pantoea sp. JZ29]|nr:MULTISPECIES: RecT family recombinase [Pantoea]NRH24722.1 recombinase RecT [Pantoea stewartii]WRH23022.1 recombinase RecT [Pantoea sp. JZ29]
MNTPLMNTDAENAGTASMIFSPDALDKLIRFADIMASSRVSVPAHLAGKTADCLAVAMQAAQWRMNPFAVAQKTFLVNGVLGYEAQLVNAVITTMAPTRDRPHYEWFGPWEKVLGKFVEKTSGKGHKYTVSGWTLEDEADCGVRVWATMKNEQEPRVLELLLSQAQVRNSTLWASDPKQQLAYLAVKRWARLHCPDVILGVYTIDELEVTVKAERDVTPPTQSGDLNDYINQSMKIDDAEIGNKAEEENVFLPDNIKAETPAPALPPQRPARSPVKPSDNPQPAPLQCKAEDMGEVGTGKQKRTPEELLTDFCEAAINSKSVKALDRCYAYAAKVLQPTPALLEKATDIFLVRKAEIEEEELNPEKL